MIIRPKIQEETNIKKTVLVFIKSPDEEKVKSRLASVIGEEKAIILYKSFILDIIETIQRGNYPLKIYFHPPDSGDALKSWMGNNCDYLPQRGDDLGERMKNAFIQSFSEGLEKVLLIGSDIPDLKLTVVNEAFESLNDHDAVIGPASDGGYYLIGFKKSTFLPDIFNGIPWGGDSVFLKTMEVFNRTGWVVHILPEWRDVDTMDDLRSLFAMNIDTGFRNSRTMSYIMKNRIFPG
jgi:rSAM/selenodomain-associated transferase 1